MRTIPRLQSTVSPAKTAAISLAVALALAGCAVGPDFKAPAAPSASRFTESPLPAATASAPGIGGAAQHLNSGADIPLEWWTAFHSPEIDQLVREALANSPTLAAAQATLRQARETLRANEGALLSPSVTGSLQGSRERTNVTAGGTAPVNGPSGPSSSSLPLELTTLNATLDVSYNVDVFGGAHRQIEGSRAQVDFQREELEATYLTLTANVVTTALSEASYRAQLKATRDIADSQQLALDVVERQFEAGAVSRATVLQQRTQLATTKASIPGLEKSLAQTRHQLAVLVGKTPSEASIPDIDLEKLTLPTDLPVSLPSNLLKQRPDIRASEAQLHQASAQVGVATANMLPQFNITGEYGYSNSKLSDLLNPASIIWNLAGGLTAPVFNGGQLSAQRRAALDAYDAALNQYRNTVLLAFQNVADTLVALDSDAETLAANADADDLARQSLELTQSQYKLGAASYLSLLTAEQQFFQAHTTLVQAQARRFTDTATLFQALGGGWWNRTEPLAAVSSPADATEIK